MKTIARAACLIFLIWAIGCGVIALSPTPDVGMALGWWTGGVILGVALGVLVWRGPE